METKKKIWLIAGGMWLILLLFFLFLLWVNRPPHLPVPENITNFSVTFQERNFHFHKKAHHWLLDGENVQAERIAAVLEKLRNCQNPYPQDKLPPLKNPNPVIIKMAEKTYFLDGYNSLHHSHYLNDGENIWFCDEGLKAILAQPKESWFQTKK